MLDDIAIERIGQQLGNIAVNFISLERDVEILRENTTVKQTRIEELEKEMLTIIEQRDSLQREIYRLETLLLKTS
jgi:membrane protein involved in colicin uptake